jgi:transcriptional regulator with XRE-family HTH domain
VRQLESAEAEGSITLRTLARIAHGLDCEVRYVLVPRTSLSEQVVQRAMQHEEGETKIDGQTVAFDAESLAAFASVFERLGDKKFW